jgi:DNA ligase 1
MSKRIKISETEEKKVLKGRIIHNGFVDAKDNSLEEVKEHKKTKGKDKKPAVEGTRKSTRARNVVETYDLDVLIPKVTDSPSNKAMNPMLASKYDGTQDIKNWIMSEKLDGLRCVWDGEKLLTRNGNLFYPPDYFIKDFPKDIILDGELFMDRGEFQKTVSIVRKHDKGDGWKKIKYLVFDGPAIPGGFSKRLKVLEEKLSTINSPYIKLHEQRVCKSAEHLEEEMKRITGLGGEGVMLRDPKSKYEHRRVKTMLKVKEFHDDEATVLGQEKGTGRLEQLMGALVVKNKAGKTFKVGSGFTDKERAKPPKKGTVITYRYFELTKDGIPRFPTFMRVHPGM